MHVLHTEYIKLLIQKTFNMQEELIPDMDQLLREICEHDSERALRKLYLYYFNKLMRFVSIYVKSELEAEEIISDVFLNVWQNRKKLTEVKNFNAYLYATARNAAIDFLRSSRNVSFNSIEEEQLEVFTKTTTTPEDDLISKETIEKINRAIETLPTQCKIAFKLIREDQLKYKEVAEILNISVKTIETHINKATKVLRKALLLIISVLCFFSKFF